MFMTTQSSVPLPIVNKIMNMEVPDYQLSMKALWNMNMFILYPYLICSDGFESL